MRQQPNNGCGCPHCSAERILHAQALELLGIVDKLADRIDGLVGTGVYDASRLSDDERHTYARIEVLRDSLVDRL